MNSPSKDIAQLLASDSSLGLTVDTDLFYQYMPAEKAGVVGADIVTVIDNAGGPPMLQFDKTKSDYYYPQVSVQVRNIDQDAGYAQIFAIFQYLHGSSQITLNGTDYVLIKAVSDPQLLHIDENQRRLFVCSFDIQRRPAI